MLIMSETKECESTQNHQGAQNRCRQWVTDEETWHDKQSTNLITFRQRGIICDKYSSPLNLNPSTWQNYYGTVQIVGHQKCWQETPGTGCSGHHTLLMPEPSSTSSQLWIWSSAPAALRHPVNGSRRADPSRCGGHCEGQIWICCEMLTLGMCQVNCFLHVMLNIRSNCDTKPVINIANALGINPRLARFKIWLTFLGLLNIKCHRDKILTDIQFI